ncbi:low-specificity L-threonine aldolase [Desulfosporosinus meridiei]|uniref:Threonine aldolase n=1 Tax=Desulfosporosinus meridiei (strain ATCC BAA-275 / DSM 13257 / KCTC 12902 / NCIMB 13706 / S10) TaxID=768704 RepID=J7ITB9_DESMD|nr:low-specificity L-threonine aldolase [Desulfosporosinus meridiei]AFQ43409.1 threonine aldolase [Desulfosporosinus meridiei DSM 13257]
MWIDLRSDTVTQPTKEMRQAMALAEVGDDVYGDDPTVNKLELLASELLGKEAALFVPSGTFGNQLAIMSHTQRGDEILVGEECHILMHEVGAAAVLAGVQTRSFPTDKGRADLKKLEKMIRSQDIHFPNTGLICLENAHSSGTAVPLDNMKAVYHLAKSKDIPVHIDGARIFNAAAALGVEVKEIAACADSINVCLSKGLCAPVGSILVGGNDFIVKARKNRKLMGGGLRQAGILAAAGVIALTEMTSRLGEDHKNARYLANRLEEIESCHVLRDRLDINMVFFTLPEVIISESALIAGLNNKKIKINGQEDGEYRFVTNYGVSIEDIDKVVQTIKDIIVNKETRS